MFKGRSAKVTYLGKDKDGKIDVTSDVSRFEQKLDIVLDRVERIGVKVFVGICIFVALDTVRRVAVEASKDESSSE